MQVSNNVVEYVRNDINTQHRDGVWFIHGSERAVCGVLVCYQWCKGILRILVTDTEYYKCAVWEGEHLMG